MTSLASRTQFEVLGLGLEPCKSSIMPCTIFWLVENGPRSWPNLFRLGACQRPREKILKNARILRNICDYFERRFFCFVWTLEIAWFCGNFARFLSEDLFLENTSALCPWSLASSISALGLERVCPWKVCSWPCIFLCPWPRALCPRLHLWLCFCRRPIESQFSPKYLSETFFASCDVTRGGQSSRKIYLSRSIVTYSKMPFK